MTKNTDSLPSLQIDELANVTGGGQAPAQPKLLPKPLTQQEQMLKHGGTVKNGIWFPGPKGPGIAVSNIPGVVSFGIPGQ